MLHNFIQKPSAYELTGDVSIEIPESIKVKGAPPHVACLDDPTYDVIMIDLSKLRQVVDNRDRMIADDHIVSNFVWFFKEFSG